MSKDNRFPFFKVLQLNRMKIWLVFAFLVLMLASTLGWSKEAVPVAEDPEVEKKNAGSYNGFALLSLSK